MGEAGRRAAGLGPVAPARSLERADDGQIGALHNGALVKDGYPQPSRAFVGKLYSVVSTCNLMIA